MPIHLLVNDYNQIIIKQGKILSKKLTFYQTNKWQNINKQSKILLENNKILIMKKKC